MIYNLPMVDILNKTNILKLTLNITEDSMSAIKNKLAGQFIYLTSYNRDYFVSIPKIS